MIQHNISSIPTDHEIQVYHYGMEKCDSGHFFGPAVRDHFLIHFILGGKGIFKAGGKTYVLHENQAFLIVPGEVTYYQADLNNPWVYTWLGFNGSRAGSILEDAGFTSENPVINFDGRHIPGFMEEMLMVDINETGGALKLKALLYMVLSEVQKSAGSGARENRNINYRQVYVQRALDFIQKNYSSQIYISDIAKYLGLDRSYFSSIFKEGLSMSPQEYLINFRMKKAAELLQTTALTVGDIARSAGYTDPLCFSKIFKRVTGLSPLNYRNRVFRK